MWVFLIVLKAVICISTLYCWVGGGVNVKSIHLPLQLAFLPDCSFQANQGGWIRWKDGASLRGCIPFLRAACKCNHHTDPLTAEENHKMEVFCFWEEEEGAAGKAFGSSRLSEGEGDLERKVWSGCTVKRIMA